MAQIIENNAGKGGGGKRKPKKHSTAIDMTPMVDLMCLLITFFMLTTAFSKPKVMEIVLPEKDVDTTKTKSPPVDKKRAVTIILAENDIVYYYEGLAKPDSLPALIKTDYSKDGIRKFLLKRNKPLFDKIIELKEKIKKGELVLPKDSVSSELKKLKNDDHVGPIVLIKAADNIKYKNFVDIIDEMAITNIARYAVVDLNALELKMLELAPK
ncbi:MAG: biopolymer transporter ExbD [Bacteroidia bacterium]|nr:biopolymer transporter ExbD [Bacteroidia bacterium]